MNGKVSWNKLMMFALSELNFDTMLRRFIYFIFSVFSIILLVQCKKPEIDSDGSITYLVQDGGNLVISKILISVITK